MLKKIAFAGVGIALLASPLISSADTLSDMQAQIQALLARIATLQAQATQTSPILPPVVTGQPDDYGTGVTVGSYCPKLSVTMQRGSRDASTGGQVSELQTFLTDYFNLDENIVVGGYFGNLTKKYLVQFQTDRGLPAFGIAGSMTRAKIAEVCGGIPVSPVSATIDQNGQTLMSGNLSITGTARDASAVIVTLVSADPSGNPYGWRTDWNSLGGILRGSSTAMSEGENRFYSYTVAVTGDRRYSASFQNIPSGKYTVLIHNSDYSQYALMGTANIEVNESTASGPLTVNAWLEDPTGQGKEKYTLGDQLVIKWTINPVSDLKTNGWYGETTAPLTSIALRRYDSPNSGDLVIARVSESGVFPHTFTWNTTKEDVFGNPIPSGRYYVHVNVPSKIQGGYRVGIAGPISLDVGAVSGLQPSLGISGLTGQTYTIGGDLSVPVTFKNAKVGSWICVRLSTDERNYYAFPSGQNECNKTTSTEGTMEIRGNTMNNMTPGTYHVTAELYYSSTGQWGGQYPLASAQSGNFSLVTATQGSIRVTAPNGGEQWEIGQLNTITWAPYGYNPDINSAKDVSVYLERWEEGPDCKGDCLGTMGKVMDTGKASLHTYFNLDNYQKWAEPGEYYVRVVNNVTGASDLSDKPFTLLPKPIDLKVSGSDGPVQIGDINQLVNVSWVGNNVSTCQLGGLRDILFTTVQSSTGEITTRIAPPPAGAQALVSIQCLKFVNGAWSQVHDQVNINVPNTQASIQVLSPNGGEQINPSQEMIIKFSSKGLRTASMALYKNDQFKYWINKDVQPSAKDFDFVSVFWTPSAALTALGADDNQGAIWKIYITGQKADGTGYVDDKSDSTFSFVGGTPPTPRPTASLTQSTPKTTGNGTTAESFTLTWSSTNATSCTLTGTNANGVSGGTLGTGPSGTITVAPVVIGTLHFWVDCTGPGGTAHQDVYHTVVSSTACTYTRSGSSSTINIEGGQDACRSWCSSLGAEDAGVYSCAYNGTTISSTSNSNANLANALTALESALSALMGILKR